MNERGALAKLSAASQALAEAKTLDEVKQIRDIALAAQTYARAAKLGLEAQNHAAEVKLRAERKAGEMLAQLEKGISLPHGAGPGRGKTMSDDGHSFEPSEYAQVLEETGTRRQDAARWQIVAGLPVELFERQIAEQQAAAQELTTAGMLRLAMQHKRDQMAAEKVEQPWPKGRYRVLYADPPWSYRNTGFDESAANQYPTMELADICALDVAALSTEETVLFLWSPNPLLMDALAVMRAWGFEYKTNIAWIKDKARGKGWWLRSRHELLLIGVRSNTPHPKVRPGSCFEADRGSVHSRKPEKAYLLIEGMYDGPRLELFARRSRLGWDAWGNEVDAAELGGSA